MTRPITPYTINSSNQETIRKTRMLGRLIRLTPSDKSRPMFKKDAVEAMLVLAKRSETLADTTNIVVQQAPLTGDVTAKTHRALSFGMPPNKNEHNLMFYELGELALVLGEHLRETTSRDFQDRGILDIRHSNDKAKARQIESATAVVNFMSADEALKKFEDVQLLKLAPTDQEGILLQHYSRLAVQVVHRALGVFYAAAGHNWR